MFHVLSTTLLSLCKSTSYVRNTFLNINDYPHTNTWDVWENFQKHQPPSGVRFISVGDRTQEEVRSARRVGITREDSARSSYHWRGLGWGGTAGSPAAGGRRGPWWTVWRKGCCDLEESQRESPATSHTPLPGPESTNLMWQHTRAIRWDYINT